MVKTPSNALNQTNVITSFVILLIAVLIPTLKLKSICYYSFLIYVVTITIILLISSLRINFKLKSLLIIIIIALTHNILFMVSKMIGYLIYYRYINSSAQFNREKIVQNIYSGVIQTKFDFRKLPSKPSMFICNYCNDRLENLAVVFIPKKLAVIMKSKIFAKFIDHPIYTKDSGSSFDKIKKEVKYHFDKGISIFTYVTNTPKGRRDVRRMRTGMFKIAQQLNIPITLIAIDYVNIDIFNSDKQDIWIEVGDTYYIEDVDTSMRRAKTFFRKTLRKMGKLKEIKK